MRSPDLVVRRPGRRIPVTVVLVALVSAISLLGGRALASLALETDASTSTGSFTAGTWTIVPPLYLHNRPTPPVGPTTAQFNLDLNTTAPTATTLRDYDSDCDTGIGRTIRSVAPATPAQATRCNYANWRTAAQGTARSLSGTATLAVHVRKTQNGGQDPTLIAYARDFDPGTSTYVELGTGSVRVTGNAGQGYVQQSIAIGLSSTLPAGHQLEIKLVATGGNRDVDLAYDTTSQPSALTLP